jgi:hypothetical protein
MRCVEMINRIRDEKYFGKQSDSGAASEPGKAQW